MQDYDEEKEGGIMNALSNDVEDRRAVLMGNEGTLKFILYMNIIVSCLFFIQGFYMYTVVGRTYKTVSDIASAPLDQCA